MKISIIILGENMSKLTWENWCEVFDDFDYFRNMIEEILHKHQLGTIEYSENLTPGTNAVFRVNDYVMKIYVPEETRNWVDDDYVKELESIQYASVKGISTPNIIATGCLEKTQKWNYIIFDYIDGDELGHLLNELDEDEIDSIIPRLRNFLIAYNEEREKNPDVIFRGLKSGRWNGYEKRLIDSIYEYLDQLEFEYYMVHGDLTKENILYDGEVYVIDFADSVIAPKCYEYPALAFDLLDYNLTYTQNLFQESFPELIDNLLNGLLIHDFGGDIFSLILKRLHIAKSEILTVLDIKNAIIDIMR